MKDSNKIELPEYWDGIVDPETITVTLTQIGYSQDLIVEGIEWGKTVKIKSGTGANIHCYYEIWAARYINPLDHEEPSDQQNFTSCMKETVLKTIQVTMNII